MTSDYELTIGAPHMPEGISLKVRLDKKYLNAKHINAAIPTSSAHSFVSMA